MICNTPYCAARYPGQQEQFFEMAATGLGRREAMYSFLALAGPAACLIFGRGAVHKLSAVITHRVYKRLRR